MSKKELDNIFDVCKLIVAGNIVIEVVLKNKKISAEDLEKAQQAIKAFDTLAKLKRKGGV